MLKANGIDLDERKEIPPPLTDAELAEAKRVAQEKVERARAAAE